VYENRQNTQNVKTPKGYEGVWEDGRLNTKRAEQTLEGDASMKLVWTKTIPRRLIDQRTGRDMTARLPLVFPFTNQARQQRELGKVTLFRRDGKVVKRVQRNLRSKTRVRREQPAAVARAKPAPVLAPRAQQPVRTNGRYVQVGTFGVPANAQRTALRLQSAGLPTRISAMTRNGKRYQLVLAGPFSNQGGLAQALRVARSQGFSDAFVRR
jgi:cell division septation protein DedD